jgi:hypothetical protein
MFGSQSLTAANDGAYALQLIDLNLNAHYNTVLSSTALPLTPPDPSIFNSGHYFALGFRDGSNYAEASYQVTSIMAETSATPEPSSVILISLGAAGLVNASGFRKRVPRS